MELGKLSAKYESNGHPGTVSTGEGDYGGISYGTYQLASKTGSVQAFINWLRESDDKAKQSYALALSRFDIATPNFSAVWREIARVDEEGFQTMQHEYIKHAYYDKAVELLRTRYFNAEKHSNIMQDVIWSRAVQYGVGNIIEMFEDALAIMAERLGIQLPNLSYVDEKRFDWDLINCIYDTCMTKEWNNSILRDNLNERFQSEKEEALQALCDELGLKGV